MPPPPGWQTTPLLDHVVAANAVPTPTTAAVTSAAMRTFIVIPSFQRLPPPGEPHLVEPPCAVPVGGGECRALDAPVSVAGYAVDYVKRHGWCWRPSSGPSSTAAELPADDALAT